MRIIRMIILYMIWRTWIMHWPHDKGSAAD